MDRAETIIATKRIGRWPESWKSELLHLPVTEVAVLMTLVALLDARPTDERQRQAA